MSEPTHRTYRFSTFQELVDVVPSGRIADCLRELGICLQAAKASAELVVSTADAMAERDGHTIPRRHSRIVKVQDVFEWTDDGREELKSTLRDANGQELWTVEYGRVTR